MVSRDPRYNTPAWVALAAWVKDRDGGACQVRGHGCTQVATSVDHVVAAVDGGDFWDPANLRAACRVCNSSRGGRTARERERTYRSSVAGYHSRF